MFEKCLYSNIRNKATDYQKERINHWNKVARKSDHWNSLGKYYVERLIEIYKYLIPNGQSVLEIGCGQGDLLASLKPSYGLGIDFSDEMIVRARLKHPEIHFIQCDIHDIELTGQVFDFIIISDTINDLWDIQQVIQKIFYFCKPHTRLIVNFYSRLWQLPLGIAQSLNLATPMLHQNWLTIGDLSNLLHLCNFELFREWREFIFPFSIPLLTPLINRFLVKIWPFNHLSLTNFVVARPLVMQGFVDKKPSVSVIVPARNESGNILNIFNRLPSMGSETELIFVEGHSTDDTYQVIKDQIQDHPDLCCQLLKQQNKGKGDAVREGFAHANGDILMILDADLTVPPEDLPRFYEALILNKAEFVNGIRLVYPLEEEAMRFINMLGNKFFSIAFSWLLGQSIKDTLCGTKVLWKTDYQKIAQNRTYFGDFDPFGDFDLIFGAAKLNLRIIDLPIRYQSRTYGTTNIHRWTHGWLLLKMMVIAARKIKFN